MSRDWLKKENHKNWLYKFYEHWIVKTSDQRSFERLIKKFPKSKFDMEVIKEKGKEYVSSLGELLGLEMYLEYLEYIDKEYLQRKMNPINFINKSNMLNDLVFTSNLKIETDYIKDLLNKDKNIELTDEAENITTNNDKNDLGREKQSRTSDQNRIKEFIELALRLGEIPKGEKFISKTMYRKLSSEHFLVLLVTELSKKLKSKFNYSEDKKRLLKDMLEIYSDKGSQIINSDSKKREQQINKDKSRESEFFDDYDYSNS